MKQNASRPHIYWNVLWLLCNDMWSTSVSPPLNDDGTFRNCIFKILSNVKSFVDRLLFILPGWKVLRIYQIFLTLSVRMWLVLWSCVVGLTTCYISVSRSPCILVIRHIFTLFICLYRCALHTYINNNCWLMWSKVGIWRILPTVFS